MKKRVEVIFRKDGSKSAEAFGFKGPACEEKTRFLTKEFGIMKTRLKDSYYEVGDVVKLSDGLPEGHCG